MTVTPFVHWPDDLVLVLASASPRRAELLKLAGIPFEVCPAAEAESAVAARNGALRAVPVRYALALAEAKAATVAARLPQRLVLGADTVVVLDGQILEKPHDRADAARILGLLSGRRHHVITALSLQGALACRPWSGWERTEVEFLPCSPPAIARYIETGEPFDKAGAYGIQGLGAMMVRRLDGCYFNVMGLPLARLGEALREIFSAPDQLPSTERS